jgi:hypothetical protein
MGVVYYAALYYAMSVGRAEVDAGGTHEALIGVGYTIGPLASLGGLRAGAALRAAGWPLWPGGGVVAVVWGLIGIAGIGAWLPYRDARRLRRGNS